MSPTIELGFCLNMDIKLMVQILCLLFTLYRTPFLRLLILIHLWFRPYLRDMISLQ